METKELDLDGKKFVVKKLKYRDITSLTSIPQEQAAKKIMQLSTGLTDDEYDDLDLNVGLELQKVINEMNGLTDFQKPPEK